jgi:hypothetical protein
LTYEQCVLQATMVYTVKGCVKLYYCYYVLLQLCIYLHATYTGAYRHTNAFYITHYHYHCHCYAQQVQQLVSLVYTLAEVVLDKTVREILMREGIAPISAKGFYEFYKDGEHRHRLYNEIMFIRGIEIVNEIDKVCMMFHSTT